MVDTILATVDRNISILLSNLLNVYPLLSIITYFYLGIQFWKVTSR